MSPATVKVSDLHHNYGATPALQGVSLSIGAGIVGLLGPNGAGKTTFLRSLATLLQPDSGEIRVLGYDSRSAADRLEIRRNIGYMPQEARFHGAFTCSEFLDYLSLLREITERQSRLAAVKRALETVGLTDRADTRIRNLSGGMRRRLLLAQALLTQPAVLLLDEPTVGLDPEQRFRFRELITASATDGCTILLSTHQTEDVSALCDQIAVLSNGTVRFVGTPDELAAVAEGRVWVEQQRPSSAHLSWRNPDGTYRAVGQPPAAAKLISPSIEDGYLLLVDDASVAQ